MKYPLKVYEDTEFYEPDEDLQNHQQKIVKVRKAHTCCQCSEIINNSEHALMESCFMDGPRHAYTCIPCCDKWLDEIEGEEEPGQEHDSDG